MKCLLLIVILGSWSLAWADEALTAANMSAAYPRYVRWTKQPYSLAAEFVDLCRPLSSEEMDKREAKRGPHREKSAHFYGNDVATRAAKEGAAAYPEGAVIVKEKLSERGEITSIAGMIKRGGGYHPEGGDWEFFFRSADGQLTQGKLAHCAGCHSGAPQDHVFSGRMMKTEPQ
jgi:hypothetical protein